MNRRHFQALRPVCPACLLKTRHAAPLLLTVVLKEQGDVVLEGVLQCPVASCLLEFPIIDSIPIIVPDPRAYLAHYLPHLTARDDLSHELSCMIGECAGPGSPFDATRQHLSHYIWDHYGQFDPAEPPGPPRPGSIVRVLEHGLALLSQDQTRPPGPTIDAGCSVGRTTFELAQNCDDLVLGVDLNFSMLRVAAGVFHHSRVAYARRSVGMIYHHRQFPVPFKMAGNVDFWACDASALPFADGAFGRAVCLNLLDCVSSPLDLLRSQRRVLCAGGQLLLSCPYDWSGHATIPDAWVGGHSPRSLAGGASDGVLRALLTPNAHPASIQGLRILTERPDVPWHVRLHDRSTTHYQLHLIAAVVEHSQTT